MERVAIVWLDGPAAVGGRRRLRSWHSVARAAGIDLIDVALAFGAPRSSTALAFLRGQTVPEALAVADGQLERRLDAVRADSVIVMTARCWTPFLAGRPNVMLDLVDPLGTSYRQRADIVGGLKGAGYRALAAGADRFDAHLSPQVRRAMAGWSDASATGAEWWPIVIEHPSPRSPDRAPDHSALFAGTLSYPPNVEALRELATIWPLVVAARPEARLLVAGATPTPEVVRMAGEGGWTLMADPPDMSEAYRRARIAVSPVRSATGLQIKVLDAAAAGLPQVVSTAALAGFGPGFPARVGDEAGEFACLVIDLMENPRVAHELAEEARNHVASHYVAEAWTEQFCAITKEPDR